MAALEGGNIESSMGRDACIAECKSRVERYIARKKEIEDSYIEAGLELPLASRNMNASVYRNGSQFEPTTNEYKSAVIAESRSNPKAYASSGGDYEGMDGDGLKQELSRTMENLSALDRAIAEAEIEGNGGEVSRLREESVVQRARADDLVQRIKAIRSPKEEPAAPPVNDRSEDIDRLEREVKSLRSQMSIVRGDLEDVKESLRRLLGKFGMDDDE